MCSLLPHFSRHFICCFTKFTRHFSLLHKKCLAKKKVPGNQVPKFPHIPHPWFQGRANIARMLIKDSRGLDPSDRHKDGFQPIHRACWGGETRHAETVKVLVEEGGVAWDSKGKGKTCLQITQNSKTKTWLREWGKRQQKGTEL